MDLSLDENEQRFAAEVARGWGPTWSTPRHRRPGPPGGVGADWQAKLAGAGWVGIDWPAEYGGRGASPVEVAIFNAEYARSGAPQLVNRVGINLAGPTLLAHGSTDQCRRWLPAITTAADIWCQLFSEPGAGSDLSGLSTRAEAVPGGWRVTGQKVWTSYAQFARYGLCLARSAEGTTGPRGLSLLVVDMQAPGVEIRPLVQITGDAEFNEVFLDAVEVPDDHLVGPEGQGWRWPPPRLPTSGVPTSPSRRRSSTRGTWRGSSPWRRPRLARGPRRGRRAGRRLRVAGGAAHPQLADAVQAGARCGARPRVELGASSRRRT